MVPMAPSWVIATAHRTVAKLVPDYEAKRYAIETVTGVSEAEMAAATLGTVRDGRLIHPMNPERTGVEIKTIRGDYRDEDGNTRNRLRPWEKSDFVPRMDNVFQERLYCIQWITKETLGQRRQETFFASVTAEDLIRERRIEAVVTEKLRAWQQTRTHARHENRAGSKYEPANLGTRLDALAPSVRAPPVVGACNMPRPHPWRCRPHRSVTEARRSHDKAVPI
jgi:hypothetical protein